MITLDNWLTTGLESSYMKTQSLEKAVMLKPLCNYILFNNVDRSVDGYYAIAGSTIHVFPFQILPSVGSEISIVQTAQNVQDLSMKAWFSRVPLDQQIFTDYDNLNPLYLLKSIRKVTLWDVNMQNLVGEKLILDPNIAYYINVMNMQAAPNAYKLILPSNG